MKWLIALLIAWWLLRRLRRLWRSLIETGREVAAERARLAGFDELRLLALALARPTAAARVPWDFERPGSPPNRDDLERQVRPALLHLFALRATMSDEQIREALAQSLRTGWFRIDLDKLRPEDDARDAVAFACARVAFGVRLAGMLNWIDEATQWQVLEQNARRAQDCFESWLDYGTAWARGRRQWILGSRADSLGVPFDEVQVRVWVNEADHPWGSRPWMSGVGRDPAKPEPEPEPAPETGV
ncbi:DUF1266 domain-containing protein [Aquabacterium sp. A7-Y]|uniref:DUF1266 domain-containing protein n=1 Tax=Aquabacterium sp. A7-Y TaxID=1349605 RepID=UPI00223CBB83|nr:DUF1266 domain-containing protein [Aquabacterium sp. A7-Y]MCW7540112.1 DUF1266 domain-containing protein [Aquabacterium sp. A7-Y]